MARTMLLLSLAVFCAGCATDSQNRPGHVRVGFFDVDWLASSFKFFSPRKRQEPDPSKEPDGYIGNLKTSSRNPTPEEREYGYAWRQRGS